MELAIREEGREEYPKQSSPPYESTAINALISTLPSVESQRYYPLRLKPFFELARSLNLLLLLTIMMMVKNDLLGLSLGEKADQFVKKARETPQWAYDILIKYVNHGKHRVNIKKDLTAGTLQTYFNTIKSFYECNDLGTITSSSIPINWKRIEKGLPKGITKANDRSYTIEEIYKLIEHSDRRMKMVVYIMCSSGIRAGALPDLRLKHVKPITDDKTGERILFYLLDEQPRRIRSFASGSGKFFVDFR